MIIADGADAPETQEETNGVGVEKDPQNLDPKPEPGAEPDTVGGGEDQEVGGETPPVEGEAAEENSVSEPQPISELTALKEEIAALKEQLQPKETPARELTDEEWVKHEAEWGVGRQTIDRITRQQIKAVNQMKEYVDSKLASFEKGSKIAEIAKQLGYADHARLQSGVDEFLKDYEAKHHANPILLKKALIYARGLTAPKDIQRIRTADEKNRQVVSRLKPSRPEGGNTSSGSKGLSQMEREAAELMGSEAEYSKFKNAKSRVIAV